MKPQDPMLVFANWKMMPKTAQEAKTLWKKVSTISTKTDVLIRVAAPAPYIPLLKQKTSARSVLVGAQNMSTFLDGAHTGEVSLPMLHSVGAEFVIVGHSESRALCDTDASVSEKVLLALSGGMNTVLCIGEKSRDKEGNFFSYIEKQLRSALKGVKEKQLEKLIIAYEPVWAIGTKKHVAAHDAHEMSLYIRKVLTSMYTRAAATKIQILYGGSVDRTVAYEFSKNHVVDGFLVGGASLDIGEFSAIVKNCSH